MRYGVELQAKNRIIPPDEVNARKMFVEEKITRFRNPTCKAVDQLVRDCFQLEKLSSCWLWDQWPRDKVLQVLDGILRVRHSVAHTGYSSLPLTYDSNFEKMEIVFKIAELSEEELSHSLLGLRND